MKDRATVVLAGLVVVAAAGAAGGGEDSATELVAVHETASGTLTIRTPEDWVFETRAGVPEVSEARGGEGLVFRVVRREGELGLDSWHVQCMLQRLAGPMVTHPQVDYEYDFRQGWIGDRQAMDSAFVVHYDEEVEGHRDWRQRNLTVIGGGESVCLIGMAPRRVWKKSKEARALLEAVMSGVLQE